MPFRRTRPASTHQWTLHSKSATSISKTLCFAARLAPLSRLHTHRPLLPDTLHSSSGCSCSSLFRSERQVRICVWRSPCNFWLIPPQFYVKVHRRHDVVQTPGTLAFNQSSPRAIIFNEVPAAARMRSRHNIILQDVPPQSTIKVPALLPHNAVHSCDSSHSCRFCSRIVTRR